MKYFWTVAALAFMASSLPSCKPDDAQKSPVYFNTKFKKDFNYQVGSYWVFYDSLNNNRDSLSVQNYIYRKPFFDNHTPNENASIETQFFISPPSSDILGLSFSLTAPTSFSLLFGYRHSGSSYDIYYPTDLINGIPFSVGKGNISVGDFIGFCERSFVGKMAVNGVLYDSVYKTEYNNTNLSTDDTYYYNADKGFIEIVFHNQYVNKKLYLITCNLVI
jgi:hypothetical protein